jgi:hypothetical protein
VDRATGLLPYHAIHGLSKEREQYFSHLHRSHEPRPFPPPHHCYPSSGSCFCFTTPLRGSSTAHPPRRSRYCSWRCSYSACSPCCSCSCSAQRKEKRQALVRKSSNLASYYGWGASLPKCRRRRRLHRDMMHVASVQSNVSDVIEICFIRIL